MSRVYFHSLDNESAVRGSERHHFGQICHGNLMTAIGQTTFYQDGDGPHWTSKLFPPGHYMHGQSREYYSSRLDTALCVGHDTLTVGTDGFTLGLNTTLAIGSDPMKLAARIHGQCEIHCWAAGKDRKWLADIIQQGQDIGLYRKDAGWESVVTHLLASSDSPVVMSYSVCDSFPNMYLAGYDDDDEWCALSEEKQWTAAFKKVKAEYGLQLNPKQWKWPEFHFTPKINGYDLEGLLK